MRRADRSPKALSALAALLALALAFPMPLAAAPATSALATGTPPASGAASKTTEPTAAVSVSIQQDDRRLVYLGEWGESVSAASSGGSLKLTRQAGASVFLRFSGTRVRWIGPVGPAYGQADVLIDDVRVASVSQHAAISRARRVVWTSAKLADGYHRLEIRATPANAGGHVLTGVDAFTVWGTAEEPALRTGFTKAEESDTRLSFFGSWKRVASASSSGGYVRTSTSNGSGARISFSGTALTVVGPLNASLGRSVVYLDGKLAGSITQRSSKPLSRQPLFSRIGLAESTHTIEIRPALDAAAPAKVAAISLDAVWVNGRFVNAPVRVEESDTRLGVSGVWTAASSPDMSSGRYSIAPRGGAAVALRFTGTSVRVLGQKSSRSGEVEVVLDGTPRGVVSLFSSTTRAQQVVWSASGLGAGTHDLELRALGTAAPGSRGIAVGIDGFDVQGTVLDSPRPAAFTLAEEDDASLAVSGDWRFGAVATMSSGRYAYCSAPGAVLTATFTGTGIRWLGPKSAGYGDAEVAVDGVVRGSVSQFGSGTIYRRQVWAVTGLATGQHTLTLRVLERRDARGSVLPVAVDALQVVEGQLSTAARPAGVTRVSRLDGRMAALGAWGDKPGAVQASDGELRTSDARSRFEVRFNGTAVSWIGPRGPDRGTALVLVDGVVRQSVDLYGCVTTGNRVLFSASGLAGGEHVLTLRLTGTRNRASSSYALGVGGFDISGQVLECPSRFEDDDWRLVWKGNWSSRTATAASAGRTRAAEATASALSLRFSGTSFGLLAEVGPSSGIASISVDGAAPVEVDLYAAERASRRVIFSADSLAEGVHTVTISCTGRANLASSGMVVALDAFDVQGTLVPQTAAQKARALAVDTAIAQLGKRYVWAGVGPTVFDCSGLMLFAYRAAGMTLPHYSGSQWGLCAPRRVGDLEPGDLCFDDGPGAIHHVGMYIGDGVTINAPGSGRYVEYRPASSYGCFGRLRASLWPR
jgi:cell wall-associated NlpC family hydrolase